MSLSGLPLLLLLGIAAATAGRREASADRGIVVVVPMLLFLAAVTCVLHLFLYWEEQSRPMVEAASLLSRMAVTASPSRLRARRG
jgi:hypothetical protein